MQVLQFSIDIRWLKSKTRKIIPRTSFCSVSSNKQRFRLQRKSTLLVLCIKIPDGFRTSNINARINFFGVPGCVVNSSFQVLRSIVAMLWGCSLKLMRNSDTPFTRQQLNFTSCRSSRDFFPGVFAHFPGSESGVRSSTSSNKTRTWRMNGAWLSRVTLCAREGRCTAIHFRIQRSALLSLDALAPC